MARYSRAFQHIQRQKRAAYVARRRQETTTMATNPYEDRFRQHEEMIQGLARIWQEQREFNRQQVEINQHVQTTLARVELTLARVEITLARIETILARMLTQGTNGREATP